MIRPKTFRYEGLTVNGLGWCQVMRDSVNGRVFGVRIRRRVFYWYDRALSPEREE